MNTIATRVYRGAVINGISGVYWGDKRVTVSSSLTQAKALAGRWNKAVAATL